MESKSPIRKFISNPLIQTMAMYISGGWILIELLEYFINHFSLNESIRNIFLISLLSGLPVALIITWLVNRDRKVISKFSAGEKPTGIFAKVFRNLHQYRPDHPFSTWLYRLAANHVVNRGRRAKRERLRGEMPAQVTDPSPGAMNGVETAERAEVLRAALDELDDRYREVLFLVYVEGLKVEDAARVLEIPEGTVKTRLMRGRHALKKILVRRHPEHFGD